MAREKTISIVAGKNVALVGFDRLGKAELDVVREIMNTYIKKVEERTDYDELRIRLKLRQHAKSFMHELKAELFIAGTPLSAQITHRNLYRALAIVMNKLLKGITSQEKKGQREQPKRKLSRKLL